MAYVSPDFKTKKALKQALTEGKDVSVYQPGLGTVPVDGSIALEGPHYPKPHTWYASVTMDKFGFITKVK